jgi:hypothetical protein
MKPQMELIDRAAKQLQKLLPIGFVPKDRFALVPA